MAQVEIISEREGQRGWEFAAQMLGDDGVLHQRVVTLSWADYNLWSRDGSDEPARVAEAALAFMLKRMRASELPERLDMSTARRRFPDADAIIPTLIAPI